MKLRKSQLGWNTVYCPFPVHVIDCLCINGPTHPSPLTMLMYMNNPLLATYPGLGLKGLLPQIFCQQLPACTALTSHNAREANACETDKLPVLPLFAQMA